MEVASAGRPARHAVLPAAALVLAAALSGCKGQLAASAPGAATAASVPASSAVSAPAATTQAPGTGRLSVSVTSPVTLSGSTAVPVSCATGPGYRAQVSSAVIHGDQVSYTVVIARYRGPGSYPAVVAVTLRQSTGVVTTVAGVSRVPASISSAGGSFSVSATGSGGRTFTGSLTWTCGT